jgi:hypothetical protein
MPDSIRHPVPYLDSPVPGSQSGAGKAGNDVFWLFVAGLISLSRSNRDTTLRPFSLSSEGSMPPLNTKSIGRIDQCVKEQATGRLLAQPFRRKTMRDFAVRER